MTDNEKFLWHVQTVILAVARDLPYEAAYVTKTMTVAIRASEQIPKSMGWQQATEEFTNYLLGIQGYLPYWAEEDYITHF